MLTKRQKEIFDTLQVALLTKVPHVSEMAQDDDETLAENVLRVRVHFDDGEPSLDVTIAIDLTLSLPTR